MSERFKPEQPPAPGSGPRSFWYEDEEGQKHRVEGTPETSSSAPKGERSFWYTDTEGERKQISGARSWWYEEDEKGE